MSEASVPLSAPAPKRNTLAVFWGVIVRPRATFALLREQGELNWLWPALLLAGLMVISLVVTSPITQRLQTEQMERQGLDTSGEQFQQLQAITANPLVTIVLPSIVAIIGLAIGWSIQAAVWHFASLALGGQSKFAAMFRAGVWATALPNALRLIVTTIATTVTGTISGGGLSRLVPVPGGQITPTDPALGALFTFLSGIDVFWVWAMVQSVMAVAVTAQFSWRKGLIVTLGFWLLTVIFAVGGAWIGLSLASQFSGAQ
jgi:hypothetical protein